MKEYDEYIKELYRVINKDPATPAKAPAKPSTEREHVSARKKAVRAAWQKKPPEDVKDACSDKADAGAAANHSWMQSQGGGINDSAKNNSAYFRMDEVKEEQNSSEVTDSDDEIYENTVLVDDDDTEAPTSLASTHSANEEDDDDEDQDEDQLEKLRPQIELDQSAQVDRDDDPNFQEKSGDSNLIDDKKSDADSDENVEHSVILANFNDGQ